MTQIENTTVISFQDEGLGTFTLSLPQFELDDGYRVISIVDIARQFNLEGELLQLTRFNCLDFPSIKEDNIGVDELTDTIRAKAKLPSKKMANELKSSWMHNQIALVVSHMFNKWLIAQLIDIVEMADITIDTVDELRGKLREAGYL